MAFDEGLAQRIREALAAERGVSEKRMFGGIAFLLNGNMAVGVVKDGLMVRDPSFGDASYSASDTASMRAAGLCAPTAWAHPPRRLPAAPANLTGATS